MANYSIGQSDADSPAPSRGRPFRLEGFLDLLAAHLEKREIRPVSVPVKTICNLGQRIGVRHNASWPAGLQNQVPSLKITAELSWF
jgi:hypothetical protein